MYQPHIGHAAPRSLRPTDEPNGDTASGALSASPDGTLSILAGFLTELARAMQSAAESQRSRIADQVALTTDQHIDHVRSRAAIEADALRRLADQDIETIQVWAKAEIDRIRGEANQRVEVRRRQLDDYLAQHAGIIEHEIDGINGAVAEYRSKLDAFFASLSAEEDPARFARLAGTLPEPPNLEAVGGEARAEAVSSIAEAPGEDTNLADDELPALVGVMDAGGGAVVSEASATDDETGSNGGIDQPVGSGPVEAMQQAARVLRSIAPWTSPDPAESDAPPAEPVAATPSDDDPPGS